MNLAVLWSEGWTSALVNHLWQSTVVAGAACTAGADRPEAGAAESAG